LNKSDEKNPGASSSRFVCGGKTFFVVDFLMSNFVQGPCLLSANVRRLNDPRPKSKIRPSAVTELETGNADVYDMFGAGWFRVDTPPPGRFRSIFYDMPESTYFSACKIIISRSPPCFFAPLPVLTSAPEPREKITNLKVNILYIKPLFLQVLTWAKELLRPAKATEPPRDTPEIPPGDVLCSIFYDMPESKYFSACKLFSRSPPCFFAPLPVLTSAPEPREEKTL
jgi:hypothetical protein